MKYFIFLCGQKDYHAIDWLRSFEKNLRDYHYVIVGDSVESEGEKRLTNSNDLIDNLIIVDKFVFSSKTKFGNIFRNLIKLILLPIQSIFFHIKLKKYNNPIVFSNGAYYICLAALLRIKFVANPVGSEVLVRLFQSRIYKYFLGKSLKKASLIVLDSFKMQSIIKTEFNLDSIVVQNGIDLDNLFKYQSQEVASDNFTKDCFTSVRALTSLYNIDKLLIERNASKKYFMNLDIIYPFFDINYENYCKKISDGKDNYLGRLFGHSYYSQLRHSKVVFSIPSSDASPKSVYEAIFLGCVVIVTDMHYLSMLPPNMRSRIVTVDLNRRGWFDDAIERAEVLAAYNFIPDQESINFVNRDFSVLRLNNFIQEVYV